MKRNPDQDRPDQDQENLSQRSPFQPGQAGCGRWGLLWLLVLPMIAFWLWGALGPGGQQGPMVEYSTFRAQLEAGNVSNVLVSGDQIQGTLREPATIENEAGAEVEYTEFTTYLPSFGDEQLLSLLQEQGVALETRPESSGSWWLIALNFLPFLLLIGLGLYFFRQRRGGGGGGISNIMNMRRSGAQLYERSKQRTTFKDVAGLRGAKAELEGIVRFLQEPEYFQRQGGKVPKGVLLVGPPGTGKTLLAKAVAGESGVPFFSMSGSDFVEMFVGLGAARVRDLFTQAKGKAPCIIFIDELDALGKARGVGMTGGHEEREQTLNQLLVEMDGFDPKVGVILMAATNRPEILDPALLRPGRFDRHVLVDRPDRTGRVEILRVHLRGIKAGDDVDVERLAAMTPGMVGADLANLVNEAALLAVRRGRKLVGMSEFEEAVERIVAGLEKKNRLINAREREIVAHHEMGHAIVALSLPGTDPVHKISIIPRGVAALGYTMQVPTQDRFLLSRTELLNRVASLLGGRAAEEIVFGDVSTGAHNDLSRATDIARSMVTEYGMSEKLGQIYLSSDKGNRFLGSGTPDSASGYSEETARAIDAEIRHIIHTQYETALDILKGKMDVLRKGALVLLEKEKIDREEIEVIFRAAQAA